MVYYDEDLIEEIANLVGSRLKGQKNGCKAIHNKKGQVKKRKDGGIIFRCASKTRKAATGSKNTKIYKGSKTAKTTRTRKTDRKLTDYQKFMSTELKRLNKTNPSGKKNRANFRKAVATWNKNSGNKSKRKTTKVKKVLTKKKISGSKTANPIKNLTIKQLSNKYFNSSSDAQHTKLLKQICKKLIRMSPNKRIENLEKAGFDDLMINLILDACYNENIIKKKKLLR